MSGFPLNTGQVDGIVECTNDTVVPKPSIKSTCVQKVEVKVVVPLWEAEFDVVQRRVYEYPRIVPSSGLNTDSLMD